MIELNDYTSLHTDHTICWFSLFLLHDVFITIPCKMNSERANMHSKVKHAEMNNAVMYLSARSSNNLVFMLNIILPHAAMLIFFPIFVKLLNRWQSQREVNRHFRFLPAVPNKSSLPVTDPTRTSTSFELYHSSEHSGSREQAWLDSTPPCGVQPGRWRHTLRQSAVITSGQWGPPIDYVTPEGEVLMCVALCGKGMEANEV